MKASRANISRRLVTFVTFLITIASGAYAAPSKVTLVKDVALKSRIIKEASKAVDPSAEVEDAHIVLLEMEKQPYRYLVPLRVNGGGKRGCYVADVNGTSFSTKVILLAGLEELESCEVISSVFLCNRPSQSGVVILYGKRLGFDHYSFEGSFLTKDDRGEIREIQSLSSRLSGIEKARVARKVLGCK